MKKSIKIVFSLVITASLLLTVFVLPASAKDTPEIVSEFMNSPVLRDDLVKLVEAVKTNDGAKIFMCVLETYPDYVAGIKKAMEDGTPPSGSTISVGDMVLLFVLTIVCSAGVGVAVTYGIMRKKQKKMLQKPSAAE